MFAGKSADEVASKAGQAPELRGRQFERPLVADAGYSQNPPGHPWARVDVGHVGGSVADVEELVRATGGAITI